MPLAKIAVIARREYWAMVKTRSFILSVALIPALMGGSIAIQTYLAGRGATEDKTVVVFDRSGVLVADLEAAAVARDREGAAAREGEGEGPQARFVVERGDAAALDDDQRLDLSARIRRGELAAFVEIEDGVLAGSADAKILYHAESLAFSQLRRWLEGQVKQLVIRQRLRAAGLDDAAIAAGLQPVPFEGSGLLERADDGTIRRTDRRSALVAEFMPFGLLLLIFTSVMMTAQPALQAVIEEKQQRIAEVLLGSVGPGDLMLGKLLGYVGVSLTVVAVYLGVAMAAADHYGLLGLLPPALVASMLAFVGLAVLLYGAVFVAVGAAVSDIKESQNLVLPVMLLLMAPLFVWTQVIAEPLGGLATALSLVPPMTPLLMPMRMAVTSAVPLWQPLLGLVLTLGTAALVVSAAGRIFRVGILAAGKSPKLGELLRWAIKGA